MGSQDWQTFINKQKSKYRRLTLACKYSRKCSLLVSYTHVLRDFMCVVLIIKKCSVAGRQEYNCSEIGRNAKPGAILVRVLETLCENTRQIFSLVSVLFFLPFFRTPFFLFFFYFLSFFFVFIFRDLDSCGCSLSLFVWHISTLFLSSLTLSSLLSPFVQILYPLMLFCSSFLLKPLSFPPILPTHSPTLPSLPPTLSPSPLPHTSHQNMRAIPVSSSHREEIR